jgi:hypothetical protein
MSVDRFIKRLYLKEFNNYKYHFQIKDYINLRKFVQPKKCLQLYHVSGNDKDLTFRHLGNRGPGYYFANHGRFSLFNSFHNYKGETSVLICNIPISLYPDINYSTIYNSITRYKSEIYCPDKNGSEYVIDYAELIQPKAIIRYSFQIEDLYFKNNKVFVNKYDCKKCDRLNKRCDCPLNIDESDIMIKF